MNCKCSHDCKHEKLKYCDKCGKVQCLKCGREWPQYEFTQPYIPYVPYYPPVYVPSVWSGDTVTTGEYTITTWPKNSSDNVKWFVA